jgi:hypothetical protein
MFLPNNGITLRFMAIASNGPSHKTSGKSQFTKNSNGMMLRVVFGFLYFIGLSFSKLRAVK